MESLQKGNLPSKFLHWIGSFLRNRSQFVNIKEVNSILKPVTSGVPQGSVIAPFLFAAHMGSLTPHHSRTNMTKYADDIVSVTPVEDLSDVEILIANEISCVDSWCQSHGLQLNVQKTNIMIPTKATIQVPLLQGIEISSDLKILGLTFNEKLKWDN